MEHVIRRPSHHPYFVCECHAWAVVQSDPAEASKAHREHRAQVAEHPLPENVKRKALCMAGKLRWVKPNAAQQRIANKPVPSTPSTQLIVDLIKTLGL